MSPFRYTIELCPPENPNSLHDYFQRFKHLLKYTTSFSISSHPITTGRGISGFYRGYNLARYLLSQEPAVSILQHVTCYDLNRVNIHARLSMLKSLGVRRILVVTGEGYSCDDLEYSFSNSGELLEHIEERYSGWFELLAIAGYPSTGKDNLSSNELECNRLRIKSMKGTVGAIYTQCLFIAHDLESFFNLMQKKLPAVKIVPSIALFNSLKSLTKSSRLTKVRQDANLITVLEDLKEDHQQNYCRLYLVELCRRLSGWSRTEPCEINICTFGLFDFASELLESLELDTERIEVPE